jgi:hypothetical protein
MSSRKEEKEQRRQERLAAERAAAVSATRMRRVQMGLGGLLAVAVVAAIAIATTSGGSSSSKPTTTVSGGAPIPAAQNTNLQAAAKAAGCVLLNPPDEGRQHVNGTVNYKSNPPSSGPHNPVPASDGIYDTGNTPAKEHLVHALEHGRIEIQYRPGTTGHQIAQLKTLFNEPLKGQAGYKKLLFENETKMPYAVAAVAWDHILGCSTFNPKIFDAIRDFSTTYIDTAPESQIPFPE